MTHSPCFVNPAQANKDGEGVFSPWAGEVYSHPGDDDGDGDGDDGGDDGDDDDVIMMMMS